jgi:hypothetical protein
MDSCSGIKMPDYSCDFVPVSTFRIRFERAQCDPEVRIPRPASASTRSAISGWPCARVIMRHRVDEADKRPAPAR